MPEDTQEGKCPQLCPLDCIFWWDKDGKPSLYGDCRAPWSEHCYLMRGKADG
jgi:hypothetical protein